MKSWNRESPASLEELKEIAPKLMNEGGANMAISMSIYGWWFDQWMSKQEVDMFNNGNGRETYPTSVIFDENKGIENALSTWKELFDLGYAPNVGRKGGNPQFMLVNQLIHLLRLQV